jgi:MFS family permease
MSLGSLGGGLVIPYGRRKTILVFNIISIISLCTTLILRIPAITIGKFVFGFSSGVINVAGPKMLEETVPEELLGAFGIATNAYICLGIGLATIVGAGLP